MFGRLFKLFVFCLLLWAAWRWLFDRGQKKTLREWAEILAQALLISSVIFGVLYFFGLHRL
ncbi:protein MIGRI [Crenobacter intestini]|uniref:Uncharacterized protein n=1 Tax=Crenobacter intestini TaxID=2563443 RepID=A0A4T0UWW2_9NEIS|nr:hypothetical protein [Crenobacter intestini]TIC83458.1 hypothetical protein E5K04_07830 [Crenobacter intestini]